MFWGFFFPSWPGEKAQGGSEGDPRGRWNCQDRQLIEWEVGVGEMAEGLTLDDWKIAGVLPTGGRGMGGEAVIQGEVMQHYAQTPSSQPPCPCWARGDMGQPVPPAVWDSGAGAAPVHRQAARDTLISKVSWGVRITGFHLLVCCQLWL